MPLVLVSKDITLMQVDAIVNAANTSLARGGGVCGAIFAAAGEDNMRSACEALPNIQTGEAVVTPGFNLPARYVIHTAGPIYNQHSPQQAEQLLRSAYTNSLQQALAQGCSSIAFSLISSGIYGYPAEQALAVACDAIRQFLQPLDDEPDVYLVLYERIALGRSALAEVDRFIEQHSLESPGRISLGRLSETRFDEVRNCDGMLYEVSRWLELEEPFELYLLQLIRSLDMSEVEVYKNANLSRKLFSKIRTGKGYLPSKRTVLALAIGMRLDLEQTTELLRQAGYALARNQKFDLVLEYFIRQGRYDVHDINRALFLYNLPLLGGA